MLDCGADPNVRNNDGWTPLYSVAFRCRIDMARVLFDHGLISLLRDNEGMTPLNIDSECSEESREMLRRGGSRTTVYE